MEITMSAGARCFPPRGPLAMSEVTWSKRPRSAPMGAFWVRSGRPFHRAYITPTGIDLPVIDDRLRRSAPEP